MNQKAHDFLKAGDVLARRYVVLRPLREEPCGGVWLAQDRSLGMDVGLKFMPRHVPQFEAAREALRREGALAFKLRHPYILQVLHFEEGDEGAYLIQEPFLGESLLAHLNRLERFRLPYALNLLEQVAEALAFAHLNHEVHQSLDPASVLFEDHTVKLANFACPRGEGEVEQQVTHLELKAYTAPEVIEGEEVSPAANVFSLGVVGFRLSAGSLPYALTFDEPFPYRLESIPVDLEEIPLPLQNLLLQCLATTGVRGHGIHLPHLGPVLGRKQKRGGEDNRGFQGPESRRQDGYIPLVAHRPGGSRTGPDYFDLGRTNFAAEQRPDTPGPADAGSGRLS
ncbi:MAG: protein kinase [Syntrophobacterales bacterium]